MKGLFHGLFKRRTFKDERRDMIEERQLKSEKFFEEPARRKPARLSRETGKIKSPPIFSKVPETKRFPNIQKEVKKRKTMKLKKEFVKILLDEQTIFELTEEEIFMGFNNLKFNLEELKRIDTDLEFMKFNALPSNRKLKRRINIVRDIIIDVI